MVNKMTDKEFISGRELIDFCARELYAKKAESVKVLNLIGLSDVADYYLVATCSSEPQMRAILNSMVRNLKGQGVRPLGVDYKDGVRWAVADFGEIMVHLFEEEERMNLNLENLWEDIQVEELDPADYPIEEGDEEDTGNEFI
jgi:ribosome-associated protein|tara:strand:+ start:1598 stop:2026 length:429 start_codon:yes stop_codon:yes gene_type:complete